LGWELLGIIVVGGILLAAYTVGIDGASAVVGGISTSSIILFLQIVCRTERVHFG